MDSTTPNGNSANIELAWGCGSSSGPTQSSLHWTSSIPKVGSGSPRGSRAADSGFQNETSDEYVRLIYIGDPEKTRENFKFAGNSIRTGKYSILTFLPRNMFVMYFLVVAVLNQLPQLAVFGRGVSIFPLAFVLPVMAVKDAYEDWKRHRSDKIENNRLASVLVNGQFQPKKWKDIRVGEIIKIGENDTIPCDMVLLCTSDSTGVAYVQTLNLDGESNLKMKYTKQETMSRMPDKENIFGLIKCEHPNRNIYDFDANMEVDGKRISLGHSNIVLRGFELKNTSWAVGVAVYAGHETKVMLNSSGAPSKRSRLQTRMNVQIFILSLFLIALCTVVCVCAAVWFIRKGEDLDILPYFRKKDISVNPPETYNYYGWRLDAFLVFLMSVILFQTMIPISLYMSMELVRLGQAYFMIQDTQMYDETSDSRFQCRVSNIIDDLGQIRYVFSDKTGTLTENKMEFRCASIWGVDYGGERTNPLEKQIGYSVQVNGKILRPKMAVKTDPELLQLLKSGKHTEEGRYFHDFFLALAACNTIFPLIIETSDPSLKLIDYQGMFPDEQALVYAAAAYGFMLIERNSGHIVIDIHGEKQRYNVLGMHEFDSDRKQMSVVLGCPDMTYKVFVKGADTSMFKVIGETLNIDIIQATKAHLHSYSSKGLRTLVIGMRELSASQFEQWHLMFEKASTTLFGRAAKLRKVASSIENNLCILGASGIEDKLQKGVPEAIESLRTAGIKIWVVTGDRQETVISIGYSSSLLTNNMAKIIINANSAASCRRILENAIIMLKKFASESRVTSSNGRSTEVVMTSIALIIDGSSLIYILERDLEEQFFELASFCSVVLCCRVAPVQKSGIVAVVKGRTSDITLAIGDGANDVQMIHMADVGVGLSGLEGREAVMASDFSMGQFRFLVPLLLVHGHWNYQRMGYMVLCNFYRNAVFVLVLFWYVLFTGFSLTTAINQWSSVLYSVIYTCLPTIVVGILDKDLDRRTLLSHPQLYRTGHGQESYNSRLFCLTMIDTVWQSIAIFFIPLLAYWATTIDASSLGDLWLLAVVIVANLHLAMDVVRWYSITHVVIWGSTLATIICVIVLDSLLSLQGYWAIYHVAGTAPFWLCLLAVVVVALLPRFCVKHLYQYYNPCDIRIAREADKFGTSRELGVVRTEVLPGLNNPSQEGEKHKAERSATSNLPKRVRKPKEEVSSQMPSSSPFRCG